MDKEGDIIIEIMITQGSMVEVGEAIIAITGDSTIITEAEAVGWNPQQSYDQQGQSY